MFCSNCGGKLDQEARFCTYCGKEPSSAPKAPIQEASCPPQTPNLSFHKAAVNIPNTASKKSKGKYLLFAISGMFAGAILLAAILFATGVLTSASKKADAVITPDDETIESRLPESTTNDSIAVTTSADETIEGPGFSTPEDAAKAYLTGLRDQDINAMTAVFAIESYVDNYDFEASLELWQSYMVNAEILLPNTNDYTRMLNVASRSNTITSHIIKQYMLYNTYEELNGGGPVTFSKDDAQAVQDFVAKFEQATDNYIFEDLVITGTMPPEELTEGYLNENNLQNIAKQAKVIGVDADDVVNVVITFEADGQTWVFCPQAVRYDDKWYLQTMPGNLGCILGMSAYTGGISPFASGELQLTQFGM